MLYSISAPFVAVLIYLVMENSVNYHKFRSFEDEENKAAETKRKSIVIALVIVAATAILVIAVIATTGLVLSVQSSEQAQASGLSNVQNTPGELRGQYNGEAGAEGTRVLQNTYPGHCSMPARKGCSACPGQK